MCQKMLRLGTLIGTIIMIGYLLQLGIHKDSTRYGFLTHLTTSLVKGKPRLPDILTILSCGVNLWVWGTMGPEKMIRSSHLRKVRTFYFTVGATMHQLWPRASMVLQLKKHFTNTKVHSKTTMSKCLNFILCSMHGKLNSFHLFSSQTS